MKKINLFCLILFIFLPTLTFANQTYNLVNESMPIAPIKDRYIQENTATNPIAFTVSDREGGNLVVTCTSSNELVVPNDSDHIVIENVGNEYNVLTAPGENNHLTAMIYPAGNQIGTSVLTFKVTDPQGLFATKSFNLTVVTAEVYAFYDQINKSLDSSNYELTLSQQGSGLVKINGVEYAMPWTGFFTKDEQVSAIAIPEEGWTFGYWSGDMVDTENPLQIQMDNNKNIKVEFISENKDLTTIENWVSDIALVINNNNSQINEEKLFIGVATEEHIEKADENSANFVLETEDNLKLKSQIQMQNKTEYSWVIAMSLLENKDVNSVKLMWNNLPESGHFELFSGKNEDKETIIYDMNELFEVNVSVKNEIQYFTIVLTQ